jgi:hypothetical protein
VIHVEHLIVHAIIAALYRKRRHLPGVGRLTTNSACWQWCNHGIMGGCCAATTPVHAHT